MSSRSYLGRLANRVGVDAPGIRPPRRAAPAVPVGRTDEPPASVAVAPLPATAPSQEAVPSPPPEPPPTPRREVAPSHAVGDEDARRDVAPTSPPTSVGPAADVTPSRSRPVLPDRVPPVERVDRPPARRSPDFEFDAPRPAADVHRRAEPDVTTHASPASAGDHRHSPSEAPAGPDRPREPDPVAAALVAAARWTAAEPASPPAGHPVAPPPPPGTAAATRPAVVFPPPSPDVHVDQRPPPAPASAPAQERFTDVHIGSIRVEIVPPPEPPSPAPPAAPRAERETSVPLARRLTARYGLHQR